jgi:hypothetical protein
MLRDEVERLARELLAQAGAPGTVTVKQASDWWIVTRIDPAGHCVTTTIPDGPPTRVRAVLVQSLAAAGGAGRRVDLIVATVMSFIALAAVVYLYSH